MNKKGDITVTIFVIGVIALCFFALISFYISNLDISDNFSKIQLIEKISTKIESGSPSDGDIDGRNYYKESSSSSSMWFFGDKKLLFEVMYFLN